MTLDNRPFPWMRNRRIAARSPELLADPDRQLSGMWVVCDRDDYKDGAYQGGYCNGSPMSYGAESCAYEVTRDQQGWVIVNKRGQYLRTGGQWNGDRRRIRGFKTPLAAAVAAEAEDGSAR